jgi:NitT/TauT family transport system substrate-binding protein
MRRRSFIGAMGAAAGAAALAGCGGDKTGGKTRLKFALDWRAEPEHGGYYQALADGEFAKRGLDVEIIQGGPSVNVPQMLAAGQIDLGVGSNSFIVMNLVKEKVPIKAIAAFFQKDPQCLITHPDPNVKSIADLKDRPFLLSDSARDSFWAWLKAKYGFTDAQVRKYNYNLGPFLADPSAVQQGYVTSEPITVEKEGGFKPKVFLLANEGYPSYGSMILAPDRMLRDRERSDMARSFIDACIAGWTSWMDQDPKAGNALILKANPEMTPDFLEKARAKMISFSIVEGGDTDDWGVGAMSEKRWADFFQAGVKQGLYPADMPWRQGYTLGLVNRKTLT